MALATSVAGEERECTGQSAKPQRRRRSEPAMQQPNAPDPGAGPSLWTAWEDYFATGEGRAMMACIGWAFDEEGARRQFAKTFAPWYDRGCRVMPGIVRNDITLLLFGVGGMDLVESLANRGAMVQLHARLHFNLS